MQTQGRKKPERGYMPQVAPSFYAKDHEQNSPGRSPDFWLRATHQAFPFNKRTVARGDERITSYSSATASDFHRLPYSARLRTRPPGENNGYLTFTARSIPQHRRIEQARFGLAVSALEMRLLVE